MTNLQQQVGDATYRRVVGANLTVFIIVAVLAYLMAPELDRYIRTLIPPNITVTPSEVDVVVPDQTDMIRDATSKRLDHLTYYELSLLIDSEFTSFMRMYNHYQQKASPELKALIEQQASRIDSVSAFREEAWVSENRELGDRQNEFTPLKPILQDVLRSIGSDQVDEPDDGGSSGAEGPN